LEREGGNRKYGGKIPAMAIGDENTLVYSKGRIAERKVEREGRKKGVGIRDEIRRGKGREVSERMLGGNKGKIQRGKSTNKMEKRKREEREGLRG